MRKLFAFSLATLALALVSAPATAATTQVTLRLAAGGHSVPVKQCAVSVPVGAPGVAVLAAARSAGCISSYETAANGAYVTCVDGVCQLGDGLVTFWAYYKNGRTQESGIDTFAARSGDVLTLAYTNFALCPTYPDCPF